MKPLLAWLLRQSVPLNILFIGVVAYGLYALSRLPVDLFPNLNLAEVQITTVFPGAAPEEVERLVTEEIEAALRGMDDIEFIAATSLPGRSEVNVKYADDTDYEAVFTDLRLRLSTVQNRLPTVDGRPLAPLINEIEVDEWLPTIQVNLIAADDEHPLDQRALALLAEDLRTRLELIAGVKRVALMGEEPQQFALILDPAALDRHGVGFAEVAAALRDSGQSRAAGTAATPDGERAIRLDTRYRSRGDILSVVVRREGDGRFLTVGDLADPAASGVAAMPDGVILHVNGRNAVACKVLKLGTADARRVRELVVAEVERFLASRADAGVAAVYTLDSTIRIRESIGVLVTSLISGALLVGGTLLIFLNFRAGIVTVIGVLFSFIASLAFFHLTGRSLNELSLLGFVLVVGIIVDDAIIVLENIQRHREHGDDLLEAAVSGTAEVFWPVVSATLTSMASFLPLLLMTGMVGDFFALIPVAVVVALAISLVECLLFLPLHVVDLERLLGAPRIERLAAETITDPQQLLQRDGLIGMLHRIYDRLLGWNLQHPIACLGLVVLLFSAALGVIGFSVWAERNQRQPLLRFEFFPSDSTMLIVRLTGRDGSSLAETDTLARTIARDLTRRGPAVIASVTGLTGITVSQDYKPLFANQFAFLQVELPPLPEREARYRDAEVLIAELQADYARLEAETAARIEVELGQDGPPVGPAIALRVTGPDEAAVARLADDLFVWLDSQSRYDAVVDGELREGLTHAEAMELRSKGVPREALRPRPLAGAIALEHSARRRRQVLDFQPDQQGLARMGLREGLVLDVLAGAFDGVFVGDLRRSDGDIPVRLRLGDALARNPLGVLGLPLIQESDGRLVRFQDVGRLVAGEEAAALTRRDAQRSIAITGLIASGSVLSSGAVADLVQAWYDQHLDRYPGATLAFGGERESTAKSYASLGMAFALAVFCIYFILATQFGSYGKPLLIMSNIVFSFTGVILVMGGFGAVILLLPAGWVRVERAYFTVNSFIALVGLTGLVVNDAIILIDFIHQRRQDGLPLRASLRLAGHQRLRPIVMTTVTTIAGLLPMALGLPRFSISWTPFATCFISGLMLATAMTLLVVPVLYELYEGLLARLRRTVPEEAGA